MRDGRILSFPRRKSPVDDGPHRYSAKDLEKMGGPGSGRWRGRGCETVESYRFLDVNRLSKGYLRPGLSSVYHWTDGNEVASIKLHAEAGRLHLSYCVCLGDEKRKDVAEIIPIVRVPCRLGGSRTYFICPGFQNGRSCGRRARRRANRLRQRLGIDSGIAGALPEKRKGMSARTYAPPEVTRYSDCNPLQVMCDFPNASKEPRPFRCRAAISRQHLRSRGKSA